MELETHDVFVLYGGDDPPTAVFDVCQHISLVCRPSRVGMHEVESRCARFYVRQQPVAPVLRASVDRQCEARPPDEWHPETIAGRGMVRNAVDRPCDETEAVMRPELRTAIEQELHANAECQERPARGGKCADRFDEAPCVEFADCPPKRSHPGQHHSVGARDAV